MWRFDDSITKGFITNIVVCRFPKPTKRFNTNPVGAFGKRPRFKTIKYTTNHTNGLIRTISFLSGQFNQKIFNTNPVDTIFKSKKSTCIVLLIKYNQIIGLLDRLSIFVSTIRKVTCFIHDELSSGELL